MHPVSDDTTLQAIITKRDGAILYGFDTWSNVREGDAIDIYTGDHFLGSALAWNEPGEGLRAKLALHAIPYIDFPAEIRAVLSRTSQEIVPSTLLRDRDELFLYAGNPRMEITLASLSGDTIQFAAIIETLPEFPREFLLRMDGVYQGRHFSCPQVFQDHPARIIHDIEFELTTPVRDGASFEIMDVASATIVYTKSLTWMSIVMPLMASLKRLQAEQQSLLSALENAKTIIDTFANASRDKQVNDRLDMFYFLLNARIDKEVRCLAERIGPAVQPDLPATEPAILSHLSVHDIDGIGFYDADMHEGNSWRWFGPHVTLLLRDMPEKISALLLVFSAFADGVDAKQLDGSVNGMPLIAEPEPTPDGYHGVKIIVPREAARKDRVLILNLSFGHGYSPPGDKRVLAAAFIRGEVFSG